MRRVAPATRAILVPPEGVMEALAKEFNSSAGSQSRAEKFGFLFSSHEQHVESLRLIEPEAVFCARSNPSGQPVVVVEGN